MQANVQIKFQSEFLKVNNFEFIWSYIWWSDTADHAIAYLVLETSVYVFWDLIVVSYSIPDLVCTGSQSQS